MRRDDRSGGRTWKVGELARATGTSVRTLHYYEEIGLLVPAHRTESGHRIYGEQEAVRLHQIVSLRQLGLSLEDIADLLDRRQVSPLQVIEMHLGGLSRQIHELQALRRRLEGIAHQLSAGHAVSVDEILQTVEMMNMFEKYYTREQLETLEQRREDLGEDAMQAAQNEWMDLIAAARAEMERGADPAGEPVQRLARRWRELIEQFTGGDPGIRKSLDTAWTENPDAGAGFGLDRELFEYMGRAMQIAGKSE